MAAAERAQRPMVEYALEYRRLGYPVFPVCTPRMGRHRHYKRGSGWYECPKDRIGKQPLIRWKNFQTRLPTTREIREWWTRWPDANIGMATGEFSDVIVLDCDSGEARRLALEKGGIDQTPAVWTGTPGGTHFWLAHPGRRVKNFVKDIPGTDFRGDGGYVLLPPSVHRTGAVYRWVENTVGMEPAPVPAWLDQLLRDKGSGSDDDSDDWTHENVDVDEIMAGIRQGERDTKLFRYACRLRHDGVDKGEARALIVAAARACIPAFDEADALEKVERAYDIYEPAGTPTIVDEASGGYFSPPAAPSTFVDLDEPVAPPESAPASFLRPISELLAMPEVEPDWMVDQLFTVGSNGWVAAEPKVGKSWTVLELVYALSTGQPFLGRFAVKQPRRVIYIQEEDSIQRVLRRFKKLLRGDPSRRPPSDDYLRWSIRSGFKLDNEEWLKKLRDELVAYPAEVVVLDVFNRLHGLNENDGTDMTRLLNTLMLFNRMFGCAFIIVHHNKKPQAGFEARANQLIRGSGVLAGWSECSLYLRRSKDKDTIIVTPESKDAPEMEDFTIVLRDQDNGGIVLEMGEASPQKDGLSLGDIAILDAVEVLTQRNIGATASEVSKLVKRDRSTVQKRLTRLSDDGYLTFTSTSDSPTAIKIYTIVEAS